MGTLSATDKAAIETPGAGKHDKSGDSRGSGRQPSAAWLAERAERRRGRRNILIVTVSALFVIVGGAIGYGVYAAHQGPPYRVPAGATRDTEGLDAGGSGPVKVDLYVDFACPSCRAFAIDTEATLAGMVARDQITLVYHPISIQDASSGGTGFSTRAAASLGCASDAGHTLGYADALWHAAAADGAGLTDDQIIHVAGLAGIIDPRFAMCERSQRYAAWVHKITDAADSGTRDVVPTLLVDGSSVNPTLASLTAAVADAYASSARGK